MCKLVTGLLTKKCKLFSGRDKNKEAIGHYKHTLMSVCPYSRESDS